MLRESLSGDLFAANQYAEKITATEAEPVATSSNDTRSAVSHHLHRHSRAKPHLFQSAYMLATPHKLVNLCRLAGPEAIERHQIVGVCSVYQGLRF